MPDWRNWQRGADYYDEAALVWLDADTLIREKSGGQRSLDDFARAFFGLEDGRVQPLTYRFDDVVEALERIQPHDWRRFLRERLDRHEPQAPLDGLERAGWRLSWAETESPLAHNSDSEWRSDDFAYSLGLYLKRDGQVDGVLWDSPAWSAGLSRAVQLVAVNGTAYKAERLAAAITANKGGQAPIALLLRRASAIAASRWTTAAACATRGSRASRTGPSAWTLSCWRRGAEHRHRAGVESASSPH